MVCCLSVSNAHSYRLYVSELDPSDCVMRQSSLTPQAPKGFISQINKFLLEPPMLKLMSKLGTGVCRKFHAKSMF